MFVVISKFRVENGANDSGEMRDSVKRAFVDRPHLVDSADGFERLDVLSPVEDPNEIWLITYWRDQPSFNAWYKTHHYKEAHANIPIGIKVAGTTLSFFEHVAS